MSSREIAELLECRHDNVKRTIERLADRGVVGLPPLEEYRDSLGRPAMHYLLGKRDSYVIVAQLSPEFTARLVDRWQELEEAQAGPKLPNFNNPAEAARAWARRSWQALNPEPQRRAKPWVLQRGAPPLPRSHPIGIPRGFLVVAL